MNTRKTLLAAALALAASSASAENLDIQYAGTSGIKLTTTSTSNYLTGEMQFIRADSSSFLAFCAEVAVSYASADNGLQSYTLGNFTEIQATLLQGLYSSSYANLVTEQDKAAFQVAIWEITSETNAALNVGRNEASSGDFYVKFLNDPVTQGAVGAGAFVAQTNSYLAAAQAYEGAPLYQLTKLTNGQYQDYVVAAPIPEPSSYAMMLAGLCAIGAIARRRQPR